MKGHQITDSYNRNPELREEHCVKCGAPTIIKCPKCDAEIPGYHYTPGIVAVYTKPVPKHCHKYGSPYPWTEAKGVLQSSVSEKAKPTHHYDFSSIHPRVRKECESLFASRHYAEAIRKAFTVVDVMVKEKSGLDKSGKALMTEVFRGDNPIIKLNSLQNQSDRDEQEGFMFLYMGAMEGIRNPKSHDLVDQRDPIRTLEYLAIASLLARRVEKGTR